MIMGVKVSSDLRKLKKLPDVIDEAIGKVVRREVERIYQQSQGFVPVDTGFLKSSGYYASGQQLSSMEGGAAALGNYKGREYGIVGYEAPYAIYVHELHKSKYGYLIRYLDVKLFEQALTAEIRRSL